MSSCSNQINQIYKHCLKVWTLHHTFFNHLASASNTSRSHTDIDKHHFISQLIQMFSVRAFLQLSWPPFTNRGSLQWEQENHSSCPNALYLKSTCSTSYPSTPPDPSCPSVWSSLFKVRLFGLFMWSGGSRFISHLSAWQMFLFISITIPNRLRKLVQLLRYLIKCLTADGWMSSFIEPKLKERKEKMWSFE